MNILVVAHYQSDSSPTAIFIHAQAMAYAKAGHSVRMIVPIAIGKRAYETGARLSPTITKNTIDGISHVFVRYLSLSRYGENGINAKNAIRVIERHYPDILDGFAPDVIHAHTLGFDSEIGAWLRSRLHCPLVVTTHGSDSFIPIRAGRGETIKAYADKADTVVCVSSKLARALESVHVSAPVKVILNGFIVRQMNHDLKKSLLAINQTGSLIDRKKTDVTIRAFTKLHAVHPEATLSIIGSGPNRSKLEALCATLGVTESVSFLGQLDNESVQLEMGKSQFFVMPSVREGFGIVFLEAMAAGCITIGTEGEGIADLIRTGENGFLIPHDDPDAIVKVIEWCHANPAEAAAIAERGRRDAMGLTWEKNAKQYVELFSSLMESNQKKQSE